MICCDIMFKSAEFDSVLSFCVCQVVCRIYWTLYQLFLVLLFYAGGRHSTQEVERQRNSSLKKQIENEMKQLEEEIADCKMFLVVTLYFPDKIYLKSGS